MLRNAGVQQFNYETFAAAYEQDPRLQKLVNNYNSEEIFFQQAGAAGGSADTGKDTVGQMAKRATNVGAPL